MPTSLPHGGPGGPPPPPPVLNEFNYIDVLNSFFSTSDFATLRASSLWAQYLTSIGKPVTYDPTTDPLLSPAEVTQFEQNFIAYSLTFQQSSLWQQFLSIVGKPPDYDPNTDPTLTGDALTTFQNQFMQFVRETLSGQQNQIINQKSPLQVQQNQLMLTTFESLLAMLNTMSTSIGVVANNLVLLGNWQNAYTQMLSKVPTYVGGTSSQVVVPTQGVTSGDLNLLTFGYANISAQDIANWAAAQLKSNSTTPVSFQMNISANSSSQIYQAFQTLDSLTGQNVNTGALNQISNNSFFKVTVDAATQTVSFSISGVNLEKFQGESAGDLTFGDPLTSNFAIQTTTGALPSQTISIVDPALSLRAGVATYTVNDAPIAGSVYMTGGLGVASGTGVNTNVYQVETSNATTTVNSSNFNDAVSSIQGAFAQFWNSTQTQAISNFKSVTGVRLAVNKVWEYNTTGGAPDPTHNGGNWTNANNGLAPNDVTGDNYYSDYTLNGSTTSNVITLGSNGNVNGHHDVTLPTALPAGALTPNVPWTRTFTSNSTDSATELASNNASTARAEENAQLQQYIENIRSLRQVVQNEASTVQSNLSNIQNALSQQGTLMDSIIQSLESITTSIFR